MLPNDDGDFEPKEGTSNIPYDARQGRSKLLLNLTIGVLNAYNNNDYYGWYKGLQSIHYVCFPYAKPSEAEKVKRKIQAVNKWLDLRSKNTNYAIIIKELDELMELVMLTYKDQFMQVSVDEEKEFNPMDAIGGD